MDRISEESNAALDAVTLAAEHETSQLAAAVRPLGYRVSDLAGSMEATGGPYVPLAAATLDDKIERAESALDLRNKVRQSIGTIPLARPIAAAQITSDFGPALIHSWVALPCTPALTSAHLTARLCAPRLRARSLPPPIRAAMGGWWKSSILTGT
ncbi:hypothetical protein V6L77_25655 [Pannonibacter sp. Pt2-lr]